PTLAIHSFPTRRSSDLDYNGAVLAAVRQTADAMTEVSSLESQRIDQQDALDSATRAFALAETRYKTGLSDQIPMLNAENTLQTSDRKSTRLNSSHVKIS